MTVRVFKTLQGVDYIAKIKEESESVYVLEDVFAVAVHQDEQGGLGVNLGMIVHPAMGKVDKAKNGATSLLRLNKIGVVFDYEPEPQLEAHYKQAVSGIEIARVMPGKM